MIFPESSTAKKWIFPLIDAGHEGAELGGSKHNSWGSKIMSRVKNVDFTDDMTTVFKQAEVDLCGEALPVDVVAYADRLPFADSSQGFLLHSHVVEHVANPIRAHVEWYRVLIDGGICYAHVPHRDAHPPDRDRPITALEHLVQDYRLDLDEDTHPIDPGECRGGHYHVFLLESYLEMIQWVNENTTAKFEVLETQPVDSKAGNSFVVVLKAIKESQ